jgi:phosphoribosylformimino-5-aminoimidazole carboxamide ribotide isomerase
MLIIPAIDLKDGHCVRLKQGVMENATVFSDDPGATARHWLDQGARRLHLVDLNGAFAGKPKNELAIRQIIEAIGDEIPTQLGGGIRDLETIERYLDDGITYVIIGTAAVKTPGFLHDACNAFPGHIMVGLDAKDGKVAVNGWSKVTGHDVVDLAKKFEDYGVEACSGDRATCPRTNHPRHCQWGYRQPRRRKGPLRHRIGRYCRRDYGARDL